MREKLCDIECEIIATTEKAIRIDDGKEKHWLPKSLVEDNRDGTITLPLWLAEERGLV